MKRSLIILVALVCVSKPLSAQVLTVPYIPVQRATPPNFSAIDARFAQESQVNVNLIRKELQDLFAQQILNVDMLPLRKKGFQLGTDVIFAELEQRAAEGGYNDGVAGVLNSRYRQKFNSLFDAPTIQSYKEEYRRVKEWEMYLRGKNALDTPYKNGAQLIGLNNREVISILYGTDQALFDKVNWR